MSSEALIAEEAETSDISTHRSQTSEPAIVGVNRGPTASSPLCVPNSSDGEPDRNAADLSIISSCPTEAVTVSLTSSSWSQRATLTSSASDSLQDHVPAKLITSQGYVLPPPVSYSVSPRANFASGIPRQTSSVPALKLTPQMSPAALQPPVPGQSLGNRPTFSYNIATLPIINYASSQQVNYQRQPLIGNPTSSSPSPKLDAECLQVSAPCQPMHSNASISATLPHNLPHNFSSSIQLLVPPPKGQSSPSTNFSYGRDSGSASLEDSAKSLPSSTCISDTLPRDTGLSTSTNINSILLCDTHASLSLSSIISTASNTSALLPSNGSLVAGLIPMSATFTNNNFPKAPNHAIIKSANMVSSSTLIRPIQHNQIRVPCMNNSISLNVPQQIYPHFSSAAAQLPAQAKLLHPQVIGVQYPPLTQYPSFSIKGFTPPSALSLNVRTPGVSSEMKCEKVFSSMSESSFPVNRTGAVSPPPDSDDGNCKTKELETWTVHKTETGILYYYNIMSGKSTYERPSKFEGEPEKIAPQILPVSWEKILGTVWSLITTNDGKKYYYNTVNKVSSWQVPVEVLEVRKNQVERTSKDENSSILNAPALRTGGRDSMTLKNPSGQVPASALDLIKKKLQDSATPVVPAPLQYLASPSSDINVSRAGDTPAKGPENDNKDRVKNSNGDGNMSDSSTDSDAEENGPTKEECIVQFKEMLKERGVAPFSKWEKELPKFVFDTRFKAVPSYSARRAIFDQYVRTRAEVQRKEKKAAQREAINDFKHLLEEALEDMDHKPDFQTFNRKWGGDPRFEALERKEREIIFNEKVHLRKKAAEEKAHAERAVIMSGFMSMLKERRELTSSSRWPNVKDTLRNDPRYNTVSHEQRKAFFNEYIFELRAAEQETDRAAKAKKDEQDKMKERERELRKRKEREEHEMERIRLKVRRKEAISFYQALLVETIKDFKASWTESKMKLEKDPQCRATNPDLSQADAQKLFQDHIKNLYERRARDFRALLGEILKADAVARSAESEINVLNSWQEAKKVLKPDPRYSKIPRKEREALWARYVDDFIRKHAAADSKDKFVSQGKNANRGDAFRRSPGRR